MIIGTDLEWSREGIDVLGLAWDRGLQCTATDRDEKTLAQYLATLHRADVIVMQNGIDADIRQMAKEGIDVSAIEPKIRDIRLIMHAVNAHLAGTGSFDLRSIVLLLGSKQGQRFPLDFKKYESDLHATCAMDSAAALWVYPSLERLAHAYKLEPTIEISHRCAPIFARMREQGVRLDKAVLEQLHDTRKIKTAEIIEKYHLWEERGKKVIKRVPIWRSDKVLDVFEDKFGIRPKDRQRNTWLKLANDRSLSAEGKEFVDAILDLGRGANDAHWLGKASETEEGLSFDKVSSDGFIYPRYDICGSPDRAIASGPNIQNFPRPKDDPRAIKLRSAVVPLSDEHVLLGCDFSSVETITNALESQDMDRVRAVYEKRVSHEGTAALINSTFGLKLDRTQGKVVNHAFDKGECVAPYTKILKADLTWIDAADLRENDEIIGFDEQFHGKKSKYRRAIVQKVSRVINPCYLVETDKGNMVASANHAWLLKSYLHSYKWQTTDKLKVGQQLKFLGRPWDADTSHTAGKLAGFFDGEGTITRNGNTSVELSISQNLGETLDHYKNLLISLGYVTRERHKTHKNSKKTCAHIAIRSRYDAMRFLGSIRPIRLLSKAHHFWEGASVTGGHYEQPATITNISFIGMSETVAIKTSTKTLITNGFLTHNSPFNLAKRLFVSERPSRQQVLQCENIFRKMLQEFPATAKFRDELWERAQQNPLVVTNSFGRRLMCFSRAKYGDTNERFAKHNPYKKYWCSCSACAPRRDRWKYAIAFLGRSAAFDALLRAMSKIYYEKRLDAYSLPYMEVHDELDFSVPREKADYYRERVLEAFMEPFDELQGLRLPADAKIGLNWSESH